KFYNVRINFILTISNGNVSYSSNAYRAGKWKRCNAKLTRENKPRLLTMTYDSFHSLVIHCIARNIQIFNWHWIKYLSKKCCPSVVNIVVR
ncbi:hypothetical protein ACHAXS_004987, partial [Conticribra weissflogii]